MRVRLGCLSVHEHTSRFARRNIDDDDVQGQAPCPACGATVESVAHLMFKYPVTTTARAQMYHVIKASSLCMLPMYKWVAVEQQY
jgi:hypothetical protein